MRNESQRGTAAPAAARGPRGASTAALSGRGRGGRRPPHFLSPFLPPPSFLSPSPSASYGREGWRPHERRRNCSRCCIAADLRPMPRPAGRHPCESIRTPPHPYPRTPASTSPAPAPGQRPSAQRRRPPARRRRRPRPRAPRRARRARRSAGGRPRGRECGPGQERGCRLGFATSSKPGHHASLRCRRPRTCIDIASACCSSASSSRSMSPAPAPAAAAPPAAAAGAAPASAPSAAAGAGPPAAAAAAAWRARSSSSETLRGRAGRRGLSGRQRRLRPLLQQTLPAPSRQLPAAPRHSCPTPPPFDPSPT
jgi:hypothetical protein